MENNKYTMYSNDVNYEWFEDFKDYCMDNDIDFSNMIDSIFSRMGGIL